jgi:hypothetical protein
MTGIGRVPHTGQGGTLARRGVAWLHLKSPRSPPQGSRSITRSARTKRTPQKQSQSNGRSARLLRTRERRSLRPAYEISRCETAEERIQWCMHHVRAPDAKSEIGCFSLPLVRATEESVLVWGGGASHFFSALCRTRQIQTSWPRSGQLLPTFFTPSFRRFANNC